MSSVRALCDEFWSWRMSEYPELGTAVGHHDNDHRWDDMSQETVGKRKEFCLGFLPRLKQAAESAQTKAEKDLGLLLTSEIEVFVAGLVHKTYLFAINGMEGPHIDHVRTFSWMKFETAADYEKALSRLDSLPANLQQVEALLTTSIAESRLPSVVSMKGIIDQINELTSSVDSSGFYKPFTAVPSSIEESDRQSLQDRARATIETGVFPAFNQLAKFLEEVYIPACRKDTIGCHALPNGAQLYQDSLSFHTSTSLTAQEVHDIGLAEVKRIRTSMEQVLQEVNFAGTFPEFLNHLRTNDKFHFKSKEELIDSYKAACAKIRVLLPKIFKTVPQVDCDIVQTPTGADRVAPAAYYLAPPEDGSRPGTFYLNTYNIETRANYEMMALCLHECEPGHHFQTVFAMQQDEMPSFRRHVEDSHYYQAPGRFALHTAYMEGWGLYCEFLGHELGLYDDPYMRFGRYSLEILRACRLVVDTGMHVLGWSRQQAIDFVSENSALSLHNVTTEVDRFITWPGQACAYKIGELEIQKLRREAEEKLGSKFDVRDFHEVVLACGPVPLDSLRSAVEDYIASMAS
ncbi:uncharacterized protein LOC135822453 [Sycon ciliatum]|uniref:uncharacterized protein LOC135822453 n=1 Tax=Sycon ciliatum TaxID=27933 RepID=UPI0031F6096C